MKRSIDSTMPRRNTLESTRCVFTLSLVGQRGGEGEGEERGGCDDEGGERREGEDE